MPATSQRTTILTNPWLILPLVALLVTSPLLLHGASCGHDFGFHLQSWLDAAAQLRQGHYPRWATTPAWNSGEPRFVFYPPISWLLGALLTMLLPITLAPIAYVFLTLTAAALIMYRLAREFASPNAALLASALYLGNAYMLFNAFERSAQAELLASAWIPLLLLAVLRPRPTIPGIAIPFALLWLTNAPAAVMGSYTFALLALLRVITALMRPHPHAVILSEAQRSRRTRQTASLPMVSEPFRTTAIATEPPPTPRSPSTLHSPSSALLTTLIAGPLLGLALPAFYLIPAATERKYVQVAMAIIPNMRYQDNFLFTYTADPGHNAVNRAISYLTAALILCTIAALTAAWITRKNPGAPYLDSEMWEPQNPTPTLLLLSILTIAITLLLLPISTPIWAHLPEFAFLQFPWRLDTIAAPILALALAITFTRSTPPQPDATLPGAPSIRGFMRMGGLATLLALILPFALTLIGYHFFAQSCDIYASPAPVADFFRNHHGVQPTDEYTPNLADNDLLRTNNPAYWLAPLNNPNAPAPNTAPTPNELTLNPNTDDYVPPAEQTISTPAPRHFTLTVDHPAILVLHLRDYPTWQVTTTTLTTSPTHPMHLHRDDGLLAIPLSQAGTYTVDIAWQTTPDQTLGLILSTLAFLTLLFVMLRPLPLPFRKPLFFHSAAQRRNLH